MAHQRTTGSLEEVYTYFRYTASRYSLAPPWTACVQFSARAKHGAASHPEVGELLDLAALHRRLVGQDPHRGPVHRLHRVREWIPVLHDRRHELVRQVRMRPAVAAPLREREVLVLLRVVHSL